MAIPMQPNNCREAETVDLDRLFEEYVDSDVLPLSDSLSGHSSPDQLANHLEVVASNESDLNEAEPSLNQEAKAAWHKALQDCDQSLTSSYSDCLTSPSYTASSAGDESYSDSELARFQEVIESDSGYSQSASQPSTPEPYMCDQSLKKAVAFRNYKQHFGTKSPSRKPSTKPRMKMMQFGHHLYTPDTWRRHATTPIESLIGTSTNEAVSKSESLRSSHQEQADGLPKQYDRAHNVGHLPLLANDDNFFSDYQSTCSVTSAIDAINGEYFDKNIGLTFGSPGVSSLALSALLTPLSSLQQATTSAPGFDLTASPEFFDNSDACSWWSGDIPTSHPSHPPMESTMYFTSQNTEVQGLGITCNNTPFDFNSASACLDTTYSTLYPVQPHRPLPSPNIQMRPHHRKPSSRSRPRHRTSRSQRRRSRSSSQHSSSRQASSSSTGDVGFVNFTPEDSRKILTGVAPSGSSKTKARREREAAERRRKLSQAAMKAVMDAGGDVDSLKHLERDGLLVV
ncbi:uncharacterized protein yc1106_05783 [Curvularia clavata]|uniref:Developmental regulatory protein wetA n=1 Tax=Curvularia clavata TaxID=95742 RepID=A0A9Q8Z9I4_CURCL|nr:uncharacterized protein yc1106_05783 [Curvularia clavata]